MKASENIVIVVISIMPFTALKSGEAENARLLVEEKRII